MTIEIVNSSITQDSNKSSILEQQPQEEQKEDFHSTMRERMGSLMESPNVLFPSYLCNNCGVQVASACKLGLSL